MVIILIVKTIYLFIMTLLLDVAIELMIPMLFSRRTVRFYYILQSLPIVPSQGIPGA